MASVTSETAIAVVRSSSAMLPAGTSSSTSPVSYTHLYTLGTSDAKVLFNDKVMKIDGTEF